ncbi:MAG: glycosyltransferase family 4 protein [Spirulinaceae cyanobacterium]
MPLSRELGGARVQLELAQQWQAQGHHVESFDVHQAFPPTTTQTPVLLRNNLRRPAFAQRARAYVQAQGHRFDIIDAHQGNLPFTKQELGFNGLLVTRSVGLYPFYSLFNRQIQAQQGFKARCWGSFSNWRDRHQSTDCWRSYQTCDLLNLPNPDEKVYLDRHLQTQTKSHVFPFGLTAIRAQQLAQAPDASKTEPPTVVFIGTWGRRKGSGDWARIITTIRQTLPKTQFRFLGTGVSKDVIYRDLTRTPGVDLTGLTVIPQYTSADLPQLLTGATVGAFPTYVEGFGFAVLEKLAAGIPTVAYAAAGPKMMLRGFEPDCLVPIGDAIALAQRLLTILQLPPTSYQALARQAQARAGQFRWETIATETLETYQAALANLGEGGFES